MTRVDSLTGLSGGPHTRDLVKHLLETDTPEMGYRSCLGLLIWETLGSTRLEAAVSGPWCSARRPAAVWSRSWSRPGPQPAAETAAAQPHYCTRNIPAPTTRVPVRGVVIRATRLTNNEFIALMEYGRQKRQAHAPTVRNSRQWRRSLSSVALSSAPAATTLSTKSNAMAIF